MSLVTGLERNAFFGEVHSACQVSYVQKMCSEDYITKHCSLLRFLSD